MSNLCVKPIYRVKIMQANQQDCKKAEQTTSTDERLLAAEEIAFLREQVEYSRELVESQNLYLRHNEQELQEVLQELQITNHDLAIALMSAELSFDEAKEYAKTILKREKSATESLSELLTIIYGSRVKSEELK
jgi:hypothetical protein